MSERFRIFHRKERRGTGRPGDYAGGDGQRHRARRVTLSAETKASLLALAEAASDQLEVAAVTTLLRKAEAELGGATCP